MRALPLLLVCIAACLPAAPVRAQATALTDAAAWFLFTDGPVCLAAREAYATAPLASSLADAMDEQAWRPFGERVVAALRTSDDRLRAAALRMIMRHGERFDAATALPEIVRIYREHKDGAMRSLAEEAFGHLEAVGEIRFLERALLAGRPVLDMDQ